METARERAHLYYLKRKAEGRLRYLVDPEYRKKQKNQQKLRYAKLRQQFFAVYGRSCACCGETKLEFLTMDHSGVYVGKQQVLGVSKTGRPIKIALRGTGEYSRLKKAGWPKSLGIKILCMNCNFAARGGRTCPHQNKQ